MNIILIGYRGCGKTTVGRPLAEQLYKRFVDVDDEICRCFGGRTIAEIWADEGERAYRDVECEVTADLCGRDDQVIGLGGGTLGEPPARRSVEVARIDGKILIIGFCINVCHRENMGREGDQ